MFEQINGAAIDERQKVSIQSCGLEHLWGLQNEFGHQEIPSGQALHGTAVVP
jgi:hypothetical protein